jgi:cyclohexa-1,5-dienecarbonyl-CoA hydratase
MQFNNISLEIQDGIAKITIDRPPLNVLDIKTMKEINQALESITNDQTLKLLIITGKGKNFSGGVDVQDHTMDKYEEMIEVFHKMFRLLIVFPRPTVSVINGAALGGGCELATFCDMAIASETAKIGQPEIKIGVLPPIAAITLPRLIGRKKALELILTGEAVNAEEALKLGLVNYVVPEETLEEEVNKFARKFVNLSGVILGLTKRAAMQGIDNDFEQVLQKVEHIYNREMMNTKDAQEGLQSFMEKRRPVWQNK